MIEVAGPENGETPRRAPVSRRRRSIRLAVTSVVVLLIVLAVRRFVADVPLVVESSMWPVFRGGEDRILLNRLAMDPKRWEIWLFRSDEPDARPFVKRVLAEGGEYVDLRAGDLWVGSVRNALQRVSRPPPIADSMMVPVYPGSLGASLDRFRVQGPSGSLQVEGDGLVLDATAGSVAAFLRTRMDVVREGIHDDHVDAHGKFMPGIHPVSDVRVDLVIDRLEGGPLRVVHELKGRQEVRSVLITAGSALLEVGKDPPRVEHLPWDGSLPLRLRIETLDGVFRVVRLGESGPEEAWVREPRDTDRHQGYSRVRLELERGRARIGRLDVFRDVYYFWPSTRAMTGAYHVDEGLFLVGDNAPVSSDSRDQGPVPLRRLLGRAERVLWPWRRARDLP